MQHAVDMGDALVELCLPVVWFDLRGEGIPVEPEARDELSRNFRPVLARIRGDVRRKGAGCTAELAEVLARGDVRRQPLQTPDEDGKLLTEGGGCRWLAVCVGEHHDIRVLQGKSTDAVDNRTKLRQPDVLHRRSHR